MDIRIHSEAHEGDMERDIIVSSPLENGNIQIIFTNYWEDHRRYSFHITREAAEKFMTVLDLILSEDEKD